MRCHGGDGGRLGRAASFARLTSERRVSRDGRHHRSLGPTLDTHPDVKNNMLDIYSLRLCRMQVDDAVYREAHYAYIAVLCICVRAVRDVGDM